jgi:hypothetical protein
MSAKLSSKIRLFLEPEKDLLAFGSIIQNLICLLSLNHEIFTGS